MVLIKTGVSTSICETLRGLQNVPHNSSVLGLLGWWMGITMLRYCAQMEVIVLHVIRIYKNDCRTHIPEHFGG